VRLSTLLAAIAFGALVAAPRVPDAQPPGRTYRIGMLLITSRAHPGADRLLQPFMAGMRELGYVEGRNLLLEWREGDGHPERLPGLAAELVVRKVDLIIAGGHEAAHAAKSATDAIPIVFVASRDPLGQGLVNSLSRPGGNVTGFTVEPLSAKRLELLREVAPGVGRVAVIYAPDEAPFIEAMRQPSVALALQILPHELKKGADVDDVLHAVDRERADGLLVLGGLGAYVQRERILAFAAARRLPAIHPLGRWAEDGGLVSYAVNYADNWRRTVSYADRILKGAQPAELPVQQPTRLELLVNLKAARALGIAIPRPVLLRADRVIE
jgi:putative ABC transport system substrate-binding protein